MTENTPQIARIRAALSEVRANKDLFTSDSFTQIVLALLERMRKAQTIRTNEETPTTSDEIRLVTVMFVDIVDSTVIAQAMDNSDWKATIDAAHTRIAQVVSQFDGQVGQYLGDGVLCFFGAQHSRSDDAVRAVSCALAIQDELEAFGNDVFLQYGVEFAARLAISTGKLVVGMIGGASKQELLALGPATNLASRLQQLAPVGGIVIDAATFMRVRTTFIIEEQPPALLKGFDAPVTYYHVLARQITTHTQLATTSLVGLEIPFINRYEAIRTLHNYFNQTQHSQQRISVTITGALGIGKSRLMVEIMRQIQPHTSATIIMSAQYEKRQVSYQILRDMLLRVCNLTDDTPAEVARSAINEYITQTWQHPDAPLAASVMAFMAGFGGEHTAHIQPLLRSGQDAAQSGFAWVARYLQGITQDAPLLLVVDNLQWLDDASRALLQHLHDSLSETACFMLMALRDEALDAHLDLVPPAADHIRVALAPLSDSDTADLVNDVRRFVRGAPEMLVSLIQERAEGNPFFIIEFLGMLFDNGVFSLIADQHWQWNHVQFDATASHLPDGLIGVLQARMDDLTPEARQVLQIAAVVGQTFWLGVIEEITRLNLQPILQILVDREMIYANADSGLEGESQYTFRHALYHDVAYNMLPRAIRESYHRTIAQWLVTRIAGKNEYYGLLAFQFEKGGQYEAALFTYLESVQNRVARGLRDEALTMIERSLALSRNVPREVAITITSQLWMIRATLYNELLRYDEAIADSQTALTLLDELPSNQLVHVRVEAARMLGVAHRSLGNYSAAISALSQAFEIMTDDNPVQLASLLRSFGSLSLYMGLLDEALAYQKRSYEYAHHSEHQTSITGATTQLGLIALEQGHITTALNHFQTVLQINHERGYTHFKVGDLRHIGQVYQTLMHYERAFAVYEEARELQHQLGAPDNLLDALHGLCLMQLGDVELGMQQVAHAATSGHVDVYHRHLLRLTYIQACHKYGDYDHCLDTAHNFLEQTQSLSPILKGRARYYIAMVYLHRGEVLAAKQMLEDALALEVEYGGRDVWLHHAALADAAADNPQQAQRHRQQAAAILRQWADDLVIHPDLQYAFQQSANVGQLI